jgi:hypothetical protein
MTRASGGHQHDDGDAEDDSSGGAAHEKLQKPRMGRRRSAGERLETGRGRALIERRADAVDVTNGARQGSRTLGIVRVATGGLSTVDRPPV